MVRKAIGPTIADAPDCTYDASALALVLETSALVFSSMVESFGQSTLKLPLGSGSGRTPTSIIDLTKGRRIEGSAKSNRLSSTRSFQLSLS